MELPSQTYRRRATIYVCVGVCYCVGTHPVPFLQIQVAARQKKKKGWKTWQLMDEEIEIPEYQACAKLPTSTDNHPSSEACLIGLRLAVFP